MTVTEHMHFRKNVPMPLQRCTGQASSARASPEVFLDSGRNGPMCNPTRRGSLQRLELHGLW